MMFSVVIPCYNMAEWVGETIDSVKAQTYHDWECVIVDDGSTDDSYSVIAKAIEGDSRFTLIHRDNAGVAAARNTAIAASRGEYILPLDADDTLRPNALFEFCCAWHIAPEAKVIVPGSYKHGEGVSRILMYDYRGYDAFRKGQCSVPNTSCFRRTDWERVGGYRGGTMIEDYEFFLRMLDEDSIVYNMHIILLDYRVRKNSRWQNAKVRFKEEMDIVRQMNPEIYKEDNDEA